MTVTATRSFQLEPLTARFDGELVLRFLFSHTEILKVEVAGDGLAEAIKPAPLVEPTESGHPRKDPMGFVAPAPAGGWPTGGLSVHVQYRGAPPTLDDEFGAMWRDRINVAEPTPDGRNTLEIEAAAPPITATVHAVRELLPEDTSAEFEAIDDAIAFREFALQKAEEQRILIASAAPVRREELLDAMRFWIEVDRRTNTTLDSLGEAARKAIGEQTEHLRQRQLARLQRRETPMQQIDEKDLRRRLLEALGGENATLEDICGDLERFETRFGLFAAGQLSPYNFLDRDDIEKYRRQFYRFDRAGVADSTNYLLFGEGVLYFHHRESDERWLDLLPTLAWTAELAMQFNWNGGLRNRNTYDAGYASHAFSKRAVRHRLNMMDAAKLSWKWRFKRHDEVRAEFDRICLHVLLDDVRQNAAGKNP